MIRRGGEEVDAQDVRGSSLPSYLKASLTTAPLFCSSQVHCSVEPELLFHFPNITLCQVPPIQPR